MQFLNQIPVRWMIFGLAITALTMFGYNQNPSMEKLAYTLIGGFLAFVTAENQLSAQFVAAMAEITKQLDVLKRANGGE